MEENTGESKISTMEKLRNMATGVFASGVESLARTFVGQAILKLLDRFLWVIEKSSQWSLPNQEDTVGEEENGKTFGSMELVRPLPWVLFLPVLLALRIFRISANAAAFVLGYPSIQPTTMVKQVQKFRRRLRTIKCTGIKNMRQQKAILDKAPSQAAEEKSTTESAGSPIHVDGKRKFSDVGSSEDGSSDESDAETLLSKIERLAMENSEDDADFSPGEAEEEDQSESETSSVDDDESQSKIQNELQELLEDLKKDGKDLISSEAIIEAEREEEEAESKDHEIQNDKKSQVQAFLEHLKEDGNSLNPVASDDSTLKSVVEKLNDEKNNETGGTARPASLIPRLYSAESFDDDRGDYATPKTDVETTFYSPLSSKSGSPEPERIVIPGEIQDYSHQHVGENTNMRDENTSYEFGNGEVKTSTPEPTNTSEEMTNGQGANSAKRFPFQANQKSASAYQKGKGRVNQGSRKKK